MNDLMNDNPKLFKEGTVILDDEIIVLRDICVYPSKSNGENRTIFDNKINNKGIVKSDIKKDFCIMNPDIINIRKLINKKFTIELEDGSILEGCKLYSPSLVRIVNVRGRYEKLI